MKKYIVEAKLILTELEKHIIGEILLTYSTTSKMTGMENQWTTVLKLAEKNQDIAILLFIFTLFLNSSDMK